ncbi:A24 family peptidase [Qipengyuania sphaerica]|uniref:A24 family peptidase n=1 Tax=Qipengyuania sphaerica TaxID=2867243 RepID=UPI001C869F3B|nr:prepilin peptidase [Qipengyuania sphaerica]MBX7541298.1 prepilin peptidase [Qipengyuania sphaerica]
MALASVWFGALSVFSATGAALDAFTRRLPNWLCGLMLLAGLVLAFVDGGISALGLHFAHSAVALAIGYGLFAIGVWGGGDGKFYAATASFFPITQILGLMVAITLCGLVVAILWFGGRQIAGVKISKDSDFGKLPYGLPIAAGAIVQAVMLAS